MNTYTMQVRRKAAELRKLVESIEATMNEFDEHGIDPESHDRLLRTTQLAEAKMHKLEECVMTTSWAEIGLEVAVGPRPGTEESSEARAKRQARDEEAVRLVGYVLESHDDVVDVRHEEVVAAKALSRMRVGAEVVRAMRGWSPEYHAELLGARTIERIVTEVVEVATEDLEATVVAGGGLCAIPRPIA